MTPENRHKPRLGFVGPMTGHNPGCVTTQGEILTRLFEKEGYEVKSFSSVKNRYRRLFDKALKIWRYHKEIDIFTFHIFSGASFIPHDITTKFAKLFHIPQIFMLHGGNLPDFCRRSPNWCRRVLNRADRIVAPSEFLARHFRSLGYQIEVIPNVVDIRTYHFRARRSLKPKLFWMRSFHKIYNPCMAIHTLAKLRARYPDASLVMAGPDKGMEKEVKALAVKMGLGEVVRFSGFLDNAKKNREAGLADIYINTNHIDNMPVSVIEACAMGLPVVATNVGGIPDLLTDNQTGLLVPDNDDQAMAEAVIKLLEDRELAARLSLNGRRLAESFAWENVLPKWEKLFSEVLGQRQSSSNDVSAQPR